MILKLRNKSYEEQLKELNFFRLYKRRLRGDITEVFKSFHGCDNININHYVTTDLTNTTRNNSLKMVSVIDRMK